MSVEKVLAISGKPGLYELKIQTRSGFIAESLVDGKKLTVGLRSNVSLLSEISIYTQTGEIKLFEIFGKIARKESNGPAISHKATDPELVAYFSEIVPDYDADRVYVSDIKKVFSWYNMMQKANMVAVFNGPVQTSSVFDEAEVVEEVAVEEKPKAKKAAKPKAKKEEE
ncbi:DUF5606 domain-containing protein [Flavobacterium sp. I3-2]|uniref:DUF5606 family protein n=1 Tax=Flavobacterium sp. I3-2 TaxID=2748319 RepID=UPI0015B135A3|nr:DUF5606 domain-containing protein [Flavobacterium sp. I3-2]